MTTVVTGATSGIGRAVAQELHRRGVALVLSGRDEARLNATAAQCGAKPVAGDICETAEHLFDSLPHGPVSAVFAAGAASFGPSLEATEDDWEEAIHTNLTGLFRCCRAAIGAMLQRGGGRIVAVLSVASVHPFPSAAAYVASKAGALGLVRSLQNEFRAEGIAITAFMPGSAATELWERQDWSPERADMIDPDDVARAIANIVLDESSGVYDEVLFMPRKGIL